MSHFTVLVRGTATNLAEARAIVESMLAPYDENIVTVPYKRHMSDDDIMRMRDNYSIAPDDDDGLIAKMKDWHGVEGGKDDEGFFYWSTYNPKSKWDWWVLGGRWSGLIKLKQHTNPDDSAEGEPGVGNNPTGIDIAFAEAIDFDESQITTFAVLDKDGWHERAEMGWFGMSVNETESIDDWTLAFHDRFLSDLTPDTFFAVVDCHI